MSKFSTLKQKFRKIWEDVSQNTNDLKIKDNSSQIAITTDISKQLTNKAIIKLSDSDFNIATVSSPVDASFKTTNENGDILTTSVNKNTALPQRYSYQQNFNLKIPEHYLPFLKTVPQVKNIPSHSLVLGKQYQSSRFGEDNDIISISGDGSILYQGSPEDINASVVRINTLLSAFTLEELTTNSIPLVNTKKIFEGDIVYTRGGEQFQITGNVTHLTAHFDQGASCNPTNNEDIHQALAFQEGTGSERHTDQFLALTPTTFSMNARKTESRWVNIPPCTQQVTVTQGVLINATFASTSKYNIRIIGSHRNLTTNTFLGNNQTVTVFSDVDIIDSQDFTHTGYRAYYDSLKQGVLSVIEGSADGNFLNSFALFANNLPNTADGHTLTYNNIFYTRNSEFDGTIFETDNYIQHSESELPVFFKKGTDDYYVNYNQDFLLESEAKVIDINSRHFPKYNDIYGKTATTYTISQEEHSFADTPIYTPELVDAEIKIDLYLQNTLVWKEDRNYNV
jgi:hypothetical protein